MTARVLVPLDGSALAERALPYARAVAKATAGQVVLVRSAAIHTFPGQDVIAAEVRATEEAETYLAGIVAKLGAAGIPADPHVYSDSAVEAIVDLARRQRVAMIVMSTHGRGGLSRMIYGSVADDVLRHAEVPVLLVPATCAEPWPSDRPIRILIPLDGSKLAEEVVEPAAELAGDLGGQLVLLRIVAPPYYPYADAAMYPVVAYEPESDVDEATRYLETIATRLRAKGMIVEVKTAVGSPALEIAGIAADERCDVIAMATHGHGGLARFVLGSVATATLQRACAPLFVVRPTALRTAKVAAEAAAAPALEPLEPVVHVALSKAELELVRRGLAELVYNPERDTRLAVPAQRLLTRVQALADAAAQPALRE